MNVKIRELQFTMLQMLKEIDRICRLHGIHYQLFAGTALGAVRNHGFIPWDDDADIIMLRPDYERFLKIAETELNSDEYFLQKEFSEHWPMFYTKLRKNNTACIERYIPKDPETHLGVYVDIFPCDNARSSSVLCKSQFWASKVVIAKALDKRGYLTDSLIKKLFMKICRVIPSKPAFAFARYRKGSDSESVHTFFSASSEFEKNVFPREWFSETVSVPFEDSVFPVSAYYDEMLRKLYGDYMTPTPENKRGQKIHGEIIDLDRSYKEYAGIQSSMKFEEYSKSIR